MLRAGKIEIVVDVQIETDEQFNRYHIELEALVKQEARKLIQERVEVSLRSREGSWEAIVDFLVNNKGLTALGIVGAAVIGYIPFQQGLQKINADVHAIAKTLSGKVKDNIVPGQRTLKLRVRDEDSARIDALSELKSEIEGSYARFGKGLSDPQHAHFVAHQYGEKLQSILGKIGQKEDREIIFQLVKKDLPFWPDANYSELKQRVEISAETSIALEEDTPIYMQRYMPTISKAAPRLLPPKSRKRRAKKTSFVVEPSSPAR